MSDREQRFTSAWEHRRTDLDRSIAAAEMLCEEARADGDALTRGRALTLLGSCHLIRNDHAAALAALADARIALVDAPARDRARLLTEAGYLDVLLDDVSEGIEQLLEAAAISVSIDDPIAAAGAYNRIGIAFYDRGELDDAAQAYDRAIELCASRDGFLAAGLRNNLAKVATARGEHAEAERQLLQAREAFERLGQARGLGMTLHNLGVVAAETGDLGLARQRFLHSIELYLRDGHRHGACEARTRLADVLRRLGETDEATVLLQEALDDASALGLDSERARVLEALSALHEELGDHRRALRHLQELRALERQLFDERSDQRLRAVQVRFQLERLQQVSVTDPLTGLLNRRGLEQVLTEALSGGAHERTAAVILLDLDDFKSINDHCSHAGGDEVLRQVARILSEHARRSDHVARYGGEEFVLVLPACDGRGAERVATTIRAALRAHDWSPFGLDEVTASIGVASGVGLDAAAVLHAADRAMYRAKASGKDQIHGTLQPIGGWTAGRTPSERQAGVASAP